MRIFLNYPKYDHLITHLTCSYLRGQTVDICGVEYNVVKTDNDFGEGGMNIIIELLEV